MPYEMDEGTDQVLSHVYPNLRIRVIQVYNAVYESLGLHMRATSGMRSIEEQKKLWKIGRDESGNEIEGEQVVTRARPGNSFHNYGLAVDSCFRGKDPYFEYLQLKNTEEFNKIWDTFGRLCKASGLVWGGDFKMKDRPHVELTYGLSLGQIKLLYNQMGIDAVWTKIDCIRAIKPASEWRLKGDTHG